MQHILKNCYSTKLRQPEDDMSETKGKRADERFEREARALQKNLQKRKKQQEAIDKAKLKENKDHGQTENQGRQ